MVSFPVLLFRRPVICFNFGAIWFYSTDFAVVKNLCLKEDKGETWDYRWRLQFARLLWPIDGKEPEPVNLKRLLLHPHVHTVRYGCTYTNLWTYSEYTRYMKFQILTQIYIVNRRNSSYATHGWFFTRAVNSEAFKCKVQYGWCTVHRARLNVTITRVMMEIILVTIEGFWHSRLLKNVSRNGKQQ